MISSNRWFQIQAPLRSEPSAWFMTFDFGLKNSKNQIIGCEIRVMSAHGKFYAGVINTRNGCTFGIYANQKGVESLEAAQALAIKLAHRQFAKFAKKYAR